MPNSPQNYVNDADRFQRTIDAIHAMNWLVYMALDQKDELSFIAGGVHVIFEDQCSNLNEICEHYSELLAAEKKNSAHSQTVKSMRADFIEQKNLEGVDPAAIAQSLNLKRSTVERVIQQLQAGGKAPVEAPDAAEQAEEDVA
jgi:DNA-binding MarR family transcriptional regulator